MFGTVIESCKPKNVAHAVFGLKGTNS